MVMALVLTIGFTGCTKSSTDNPTSSGGTDSIPAVYKKLYGATSLTLDGDYIVIKTIGLTDHKSVYYKGTQWQDSLYEAYNGTNAQFMAAPGVIAASIRGGSWNGDITPTTSAIAFTKVGGPKAS